MSIHIPIHILPAMSAQPCAGLFLCNCQSNYIIDTILSWDIPQDEVLIYYLGKDRNSPVPHYCFIRGTPRKYRHNELIIPFTEHNDCLFIPQHATLYPHMDQHEIRNTTRSNHSIYHPALGLFHLDRDHAYHIDDLLEFPTIDLNNVQSGLIADALGPIVHIQAQLIDVDINDIFENEQQTVGDKPISELDQMVQGVEVGKGLRPFLWLQGTFAKGILGLGKLVPGNAQSPTWINGLEDWASNKLDAISERLEASRNKELTRLLDLLENNPEEGLRYALPFNDEPGRGLASHPGTQLTPHGTSFNLGSLGGGGVTDYWNVQDNMRERLFASYRKLAEENIANGQYKKAAYIYSHLLGNYREAAQTLEDGGYFREASILYEKYLHDKKKAAECLERGGLAQQAALKFEELSLFAEAAACYERINNKDEALRLWNLHIEKLISGNNFLQAGELIAEKRNDVNAAIELWLSAWPFHTQNKDCLKAVFDTFFQEQRFDDIEEHLHLFSSETYQAAHLRNFLDICQYVHQRQYNDAINEMLYDLCSLQLAKHLDTKYHEYQSLLPLLANLNKHDQLLTRDCQRLSRTDKPKEVPNFTIVNEIVTIEPADSLQLPLSKYQHAWCSGQAMLLLSEDEEKISFYRLNHHQQREELSWEIEQRSPIEISIPAGISEQHSIFLSASHQYVERKSVGASNHGPHTSINPYPNCENLVELYASCYGDNGTCFMLYVKEQHVNIVLEHWSAGNVLLHDYQISSEIFEHIVHTITANKPIQLCFIRDTLILSLENFIYYWNDIHTAQEIKLHQSIHTLSQPNKWSRPRALAISDESFILLNLEGPALVTHSFKLRDQTICGGFMGNNIVILCRDGGFIYKFTNERFKLLAELSDLHHGEPIAIGRGMTNKQLCVFYQDGHIQFYNTPLLT